MTPEENKRMVRRAYESIFNEGWVDEMDTYLAPNVIDHDQPSFSFGADPRETATHIRAAFPDVRFTVEAQIAEGDLVLTRWTATGTHLGDLNGVPASGRTARVEGMFFDRVDGGRIAESWSSWDALGLLQQLGLVPALGRPTSRVGSATLSRS